MVDPAVRRFRRSVAGRLNYGVRGLLCAAIVRKRMIRWVAIAARRGHRALPSWGCFETIFRGEGCNEGQTPAVSVVGLARSVGGDAE